jgi:hypothetical protein
MQRGSPRQLAVLLSIAASACTPNAAPPTRPAKPLPASTGTALVVPFGRAPVIDGRVDEAEWAHAAVVPLDRGVRLRLLHDGARVYLAVSGLSPPAELGFACVVVAEPAQIHVLHASAKLGSAIYTAGADGRYHPQAKTYDWRSADVLLRDEGWMATTVGGQGPPQQEFALTYAALGLPDHPRPIAVGYFHVRPDATDPSQAGALVWPPGLDDAVADVQLLGGFNPESLTFTPSRWAVLQLLPR